MSKLPTIALGLLLASACGKEAPSKPAPAPTATPTPATARSTPALDPHAIAKAKDAEPMPPPVSPAIGSFDATIDGKTTHFVRLPQGQNRAIHIPDEGIARVSIAAAEEDEGSPHIRVILEGLVLDAVKFPLTLPNDDAATKNVTVSVSYRINEHRIYTAHESSAGRMFEVTLTHYVGNELHGSFEGKLAPTAAGLGDPIPVAGTFTVALGLRGVEPGPQPPL